MEELPQYSKASYKKGIYFVYKNETDTIVFWLSFFSGKQIIYFNDKIVSIKRNFKMESIHHFVDSQNNSYQVKYKTSMKEKTVESQISINDNIVNTQQLKYYKVPRPMFNRIVVPAIAGGLIGILGVVYKYPIKLLVAIGIFVVIANIFSSKIMTFEIEEIEN